jgi:hypothetical protein
MSANIVVGAGLFSNRRYRDFNGDGIFNLLVLLADSAICRVNTAVGDIEEMGRLTSVYFTRWQNQLFLIPSDGSLIKGSIFMPLQQVCAIKGG